jgi:hypothetical protein
MVFRSSYQLNIELPNMKLCTPYSWYIQPANLGILNPLPMAYRTTYLWYVGTPIKLSTHGIQNPISMVY